MNRHIRWSDVENLDLILRERTVAKVIILYYIVSKVVQGSLVGVVVVLRQVGKLWFLQSDGYVEVDLFGPSTESETVTQVVKATVEAGAWSVPAVTIVYVLLLSVYAVCVNCTPFIYVNLPVIVVYF